MKRAFTLIELLVVIAVIALLISILLPALNRAKVFAEEVICKSNLHQYQIATEIYSNEFDDIMPNPWKSLYSKIQFVGESERFCRWHNPDYNLDVYADKRDPSGNVYAGPYWPYLASTKANICPTFAKLAPRYGDSHYVNNGTPSPTSCIGEPYVSQFSYSMNTIFGSQNDPTIRVKKSQVKSPSQTFLWAEENMWYLKGISGYVLNDNALLVGNDDQIRDSFGSFHKISSRKLNIQRESNTYESNTGVSNVLLVDGSLVWATPMESKWYRGEIR